MLPKVTLVERNKHCSNTAKIEEFYCKNVKNTLFFRMLFRIDGIVFRIAIFADYLRGEVNKKSGT